MEQLLSLLAAIGGLGGLALVLRLTYWLGRKFAEIDERFKIIDERFKAIDERFKMIDGRFRAIDERFKIIDERFKAIDERFKAIDERFNSLEKRIGSLEGEINSLGERVRRLGLAFTSYQEFFVDFLVSEGVIKRERREFVRDEARRLFSLATNPLTKEEWKRIKELLDKDDLSLEEALELRELARKVVLEHGDRPEAYKLHIYATIMVALARKKEAERGEGKGLTE